MACARKPQGMLEFGQTDEVRYTITGVAGSPCVSVTDGTECLSWMRIPVDRFCFKGYNGFTELVKAVF